MFGWDVEVIDPLSILEASILSAYPNICPNDEENGSHAIEKSLLCAQVYMWIELKKF